MRRLLALGFVFLLGCEVQPLGGRCEINSDCDRATGSPNARCVQVGALDQPCDQTSAGTSTGCVCCRVNGAANDPFVCRPGDAQVVDVASDTNDASDAGDAGDAAAADACDGGMCSMSRLGESCADERECRSGFCVDRVCCDVACTGAGLACNVAPTPGRCAAVTDAGASIDVVEQ